MFSLENFINMLSESLDLDLDCIFISKEFKMKKVMLKEDLKQSLINSFIDKLKYVVKDKKVVEYNPIVTIADNIDSICINDVPNLKKIYEGLFKIEEINTIEKFSDIHDSKAYVMILKNDEIEIALFKKFISSIYLKSKKKFIFNEGIMEQFNKDILSIDDKFDCVSFENELLVFYKSSFEQIFDYKDEYTKKAIENIEKIESINVIKNIELIKEESEKITIKKKLAKIKETDIEWFNDQIKNNFSRIAETITTANTDITIVEGKLEINDVSDLVHLIQNDFVKSNIDDEEFISESKTKIKSS
ncbi:Kiwa anti-phage protein KwaB-like domain-containing protein [Clostridium thermobutyricum]|uniref:Kiwa anti-phage protein KwaB-like domain-containing protein n=1 Tax=Clostridium thermobutyricum TaxID=29372 RepID=UPI0018A92289|nr:Kiwa anti-phage protein KwaB-like domain-containing protein [Clostridium thermobutyricum]